MVAVSASVIDYFVVDDISRYCDGMEIMWYWLWVWSGRALEWDGRY